MKINNFRGELTDNSAKKEALVLSTSANQMQWQLTPDRGQEGAPCYSTPVLEDDRFPHKSNLTFRKQNQDHVIHIPKYVTYVWYIPYIQLLMIHTRNGAQRIELLFLVNTGWDPRLLALVAHNRKRIVSDVLTWGRNRQSGTETTARPNAFHRANWTIQPTTTERMLPSIYSCGPYNHCSQFQCIRIYLLRNPLEMLPIIQVPDRSVPSKEGDE